MMVLLRLIALSLAAALSSLLASLVVRDVVRSTATPVRPLLREAKYFLYLFQTESTVPTPYLSLRSPVSEFLCLTFASRHSDCPLYSPGSSWTMGRNQLWFAATKRVPRFLYYIFLDDDITFISGNFTTFQNGLLKYRPALAGPRYHGFRRKTLSGAEAQTQHGLDAALLAQVLLTELQKLLYDGNAIQLNSCVVENSRHREYPKGFSSLLLVKFHNRLGVLRNSSLFTSVRLLHKYEVARPPKGTVSYRIPEATRLRLFDPSGTYWSRVASIAKGRFYPAPRCPSCHLSRLRAPLPPYDLRFRGEAVIPRLARAVRAAALRASPNKELRTRCSRAYFPFFGDEAPAFSRLIPINRTSSVLWTNCRGPRHLTQLFSFSSPALSRRQIVFQGKFTEHSTVVPRSPYTIVSCITMCNTWFNYFISGGESPPRDVHHTVGVRTAIQAPWLQGGSLTLTIVELDGVSVQDFEAHFTMTSQLLKTIFRCWRFVQNRATYSRF
eukprot:RCo027895